MSVPQGVFTHLTRHPFAQPHTNTHRHAGPVMVALEGFTNHSPTGIYHSCPEMTARSVTVAQVHTSASLYTRSNTLTNHVMHIFLPHLIMGIIMFDYTCCPHAKAVGGPHWSHQSTLKCECVFMRLCACWSSAELDYTQMDSHYSLMRHRASVTVIQCISSKSF